jgi:glutaredoxin
MNRSSCPGRCTPRPIAAKTADDHLQPTTSSSRRYEFRSPNERYRFVGFIFAACNEETSLATDYSNPHTPSSRAQNGNPVTELCPLFGFLRCPNNWLMKTKAVFYHAGCPVCVDAEQNIAQALDRNRFDVEIVHLGNNKSRLVEAEHDGVKSVPALVLGGHAFHINHGADLSALKG